MLIKVIGIGGAGGQAVNLLMNAASSDVDLVIANTDQTAWDEIEVPTKLKLGLENKSTNRNRAIGEKMCHESRDRIQEVLSNANAVILTGGLGGGTGSSGIPYFAELAEKMGVRTIVIATLPFSFEHTAGKTTVTAANAETSLTKLRDIGSTLFVINLRDFSEHEIISKLTYDLTLDRYSYGISLLIAKLIRDIVEDVLQGKDIPLFIDKEALYERAIRIFEQLQ